MAPSVDWCAASLLCCEDSCCLSDEGEQDVEDHKLFLNYESPSSSLMRELEKPQDAARGIFALVERENLHLPLAGYKEKYDKQVLEAAFRHQAISWIFKVRAFYNFGPLTAALAANYLDRFLSSHELQLVKPWMIQLVSAACLSLAAKMEEVDVPLLLDLQVGPDCIFEPRTIQRMELLVLSTLDWRMSSVTPFSYLDYFVSMLDLSGCSRNTLFTRMNKLIFFAIQELRFVSYRPSSIALAAVLCGIQELLPLELGNLKGILFCGIPNWLQELSESCFVLMSELYVIPSQTLKAESFANSAPQSPMGILDASFSCDSESTYKSFGSNPTAQVPFGVPKRRKLDDYCTSVRVSAS